MLSCRLWLYISVGQCGKAYAGEASNKAETKHYAALGNDSYG